jgi:hypothetical protein
MNWDAVGAIAELIGALGVIISLLYLAQQIRLSSEQTKRNSLIVRGTAYQQFRQQVNTVVALRVSDPDVADIWERGLIDMESLDAQDRSRFSGLIFMMAGNWESQYYLKQSGILDEKMGADRKMVINSPGFRQWWELRKGTYDIDFRNHIEEGMHSEA